MGGSHSNRGRVKGGKDFVWRKDFVMRDRGVARSFHQDETGVGGSVGLWWNGPLTSRQVLKFEDTSFVLEVKGRVAGSVFFTAEG